MKSIKEMQLDPEEVLRRSPAELWGVDKYIWLVENIGKIDDDDLESYAKIFRSYWGVHTSTTAIAEAIKKARKETHPAFIDICKELSADRLEKTTASKIMAVLYPEKYPIWDSAISKALKIKDPTGDIDAKLKKAQEVYDELIANYNSVLASSTAPCKEIVKSFDKKFCEYPAAKEVSDMKKIDFFIWASEYPILG